MNLANGSEASVPELSDVGDYRQWALGFSGIYFVQTMKPSVSRQGFGSSILRRERRYHWPMSAGWSQPDPGHSPYRVMKHPCSMSTWIGTTAI